MSEEPIHLLLSQMAIRCSRIIRPFLRTLSMKALESQVSFGIVSLKILQSLGISKLRVKILEPIV